jgi:hypothetical protein
MAVHASAVYADDLLYQCSIFLERQLMPVLYMQMTFYIYGASFWNGSSCQCSLDIKGHMHALHWHELPFQEDAT